jgi:uncharacterized protein
VTVQSSVQPGPIHEPDVPLVYADSLIAGDTIFDEIVAPRAPWSVVVAAGDVLTIVDVGGNQSADCLIFDAADTAVRYDVSATVTWQRNIYVRQGSVLRSQYGDPLMTVVATELDRHDTIGGSCSRETNVLRYGSETRPQHACRENFLREALRVGLDARDIVANLNWFMNVPVDEDGALLIVDGVSAPGRRVALRADRDVLVIVSNCPQMNNPCNGYSCTPLRMIVTRTG